MSQAKSISCPHGFFLFCFVLLCFDVLPLTILKIRPFDVLDITADQREAAGQRVKSRWGKLRMRGSGLTKALGFSPASRGLRLRRTSQLACCSYLYTESINGQKWEEVGDLWIVKSVGERVCPVSGCYCRDK